MCERTDKGGAAFVEATLHDNCAGIWVGSFCIFSAWLSHAIRYFSTKLMFRRRRGALANKVIIASPPVSFFALPGNGTRAKKEREGERDVIEAALRVSRNPPG